MKDESTCTTNVPEYAPLTLEKLRALIASIPSEYALLTAQPVVEGNDCLLMKRTEFMPPGCRYLLIVAPEKLHAVARALGARVSSRMGDGNFYEFYVANPPPSKPFRGVLDFNISS
jgi:hypothetical protein